MHMVKHSRLCGRAIVAYLQSKGFPEVALHFVRDPQTRFRLALACGNIEAAMESAFSLEQQQGLDGKARDVWGELGSEALRQGNHQVSDQSFVHHFPHQSNITVRLSNPYCVSKSTPY
jgi:coatomer protein complex subunit alpha (xenin)